MPAMGGCLWKKTNRAGGGECKRQPTKGLISPWLMVQIHSSPLSGAIRFVRCCAHPFPDKSVGVRGLLGQIVPLWKARSVLRGLAALFFSSEKRIDLYLGDEVGRCLLGWVKLACAWKLSSVDEPMHRFHGCKAFLAENFHRSLRDRHISDLSFGHVDLSACQSLDIYSIVIVLLSSGDRNELR